MAWAGIARDLNKLNKKSLNKATEKSLQNRLQQHGEYSTRRAYKYKKSTPELLTRIKEFKSRENAELRKKRMWVMLGLTVIFLMMIFIALTI